MGASLSELEQPPETHQNSQSQPQQHQHQPNEPTNYKELRLPSRTENLLLSPQHHTQPSTNSTKSVPNAKVVLKTNESTQSAAKPLVNQLSLPHNYEYILKDADSTIDKSSREKLCDQLYAGVFLDHKTKKYWVEKKCNANCFMLYARALSITWGENQIYWKWIQQKDASGSVTEVAELKSVCWLEVHGKFDTRKLSPGILYQVSFVIMLKDPAEGWELPVNVRLVLPGGKNQLHKESLIDKLRARWIEIPVGEFVASEKDVGDAEVSMYEYEGGMWKRGLIIKGVAIKPKE
ncbi:protein PHLOEM PROTEIN 2-LIKE A1-like [Cicer arietinum]|uniref:Protein PHLOEM PROTEIN 2-LIKE A1-like n=1 Tax=Cicer arietinum TaxID=3827 RepID=A0A1S2YJ22_CICAR|nr:protein PHLOEM PROTEIN 2-LIKE A1-like [Cicer arietinum]